MNNPVLYPESQLWVSSLSWLIMIKLPFPCPGVKKLSVFPLPPIWQNKPTTSILGVMNFTFLDIFLWSYHLNLQRLHTPFGYDWPSSCWEEDVRCPTTTIAIGHQSISGDLKISYDINFSKIAYYVLKDLQNMPKSFQWDKYNVINLNTERFWSS